MRAKESEVVVVGQNDRPRLHLLDVHDAKPAGRGLLPLIHGLDYVGEMAVILPDDRAGLVERRFVDFSTEMCKAVVLEPEVFWGVLDRTLAAFGVLRPSHNNQLVLESVPRRERPGEGPSFGLHGQISLNSGGKWGCRKGTHLLSLRFPASAANNNNHITIN